MRSVKMTKISFFVILTDCFFVLTNVKTLSIIVKFFLMPGDFSLTDVFLLLTDVLLALTDDFLFMIGIKLTLLGIKSLLMNGKKLLTNVIKVKIPVVVVLTGIVESMLRNKTFYSIVYSPLLSISIFSLFLLT